MFGRTAPRRPAMSRHEDEVAELCRAVLTAGGGTTPEARRAAFDGTKVASPWTSYIASVRETSYRDSLAFSATPTTVPARRHRIVTGVPSDTLVASWVMTSFGTRMQPWLAGYAGTDGLPWIA